MKKIIILLLILTFLPGYSQQEFEINLSTKGYSLVNIAVDRFKGDYQKKEEMRKILIKDLKLSGIFSPIKDYAIDLVTNEKENRCQKFLTIEAKILVEVQLTVENNMLVLKGKVTDLKSCKMIFKREYKGEIDSGKDLIHTFADDIVFAFTGTKGIANTKIAFVSDRTGHREVFIMDYNGENIRQLTKLRTTTLFPAVSPDRSVIAFTSYRDHNPDLFLYFIGGKLKRIYHADGIGSTPDFSSDGKLMVFSASKNGNTDIYLYHIDSGQTERLTKNPAIDTSPKFSPNGKAIVFTSDRYGSPQIYTMSVDGLNITRIGTIGTYNDQPCWSPNGKYIAYSSMRNGKFQIFLFSFSTGQNIQLTHGMGSCENPIFSPDSRRIAFQSNQTGKYQIYSMNTNGSNIVKLTSKGNNTCPYWVK